MQLAALKGRVAWLDRLARGLGKEVGLQRGAENVLLYREKKQYLAGIRDAQGRVEAARVVLAGPSGGGVRDRAGA
jgi:hypothetical protein